MPSMFGDWDNSPYQDFEPVAKTNPTPQPVQQVSLPLSYAMEVNAGRVTLRQAQEWVRLDRERSSQERL